MLVDTTADLIISQGDTFDMVFSLGCYHLGKKDEVIFSIMKTVIDENVLIRKSYTNLEGNCFRVVIPAQEMSKLKAGTYAYDVLVISSGMKKTFNFPNKLVIRGVVHRE